MFTLEQGARLVKLARHAIETLLLNKPLEIEQYKDLNANNGIYVTLKKDGKTRGQMGAIETKDELYKAVVKAARDAAFNDKRFSPLQKSEFAEVGIEVAVISKIKLLKVSRPEEYAKQIQIGTDGLMLKAGLYNAVLLPNPSMTYDWDAERLLRYLSSSAGMTMDAWKDLSQDIYTFRCQTFTEKNGKVIEVI